MLRKLSKSAPHQKYFLKNGKQVTGASTISKIGDDPGGLINWAWKRGMAGENYYKARDAHADAGEICHALIEAYLKGDTLDLSDFDPEAIMEAESGFTEFETWWKAEKMVFVCSELQLVSEKWGYGGTLDVMAIDPQERHCLLDIKHTNAIRESHLRQLSGYEELWNENSENEVDRRAILNTKNGMTPKWMGPMDKYFHTFKCQLALLNAMRDERLKI